MAEAVESGRRDPAAPVLEKIDWLLEDHSLSVVRQWKAAHPGGLAIGYLPVYVPRPLFEAIGCLPVAVFGGGDRIDVVRGDSYFQSYICHIPRSTLELGLSGELGVLDGMLFPSTCDVVRNLGGMWRMLFPDAWVSYLDLPQNFQASLGGRFYKDELLRIVGELTARGARGLEPAALREAIATENRRRRLLTALDEIRWREPWRVRATEAYAAVRAGTLLPAAEHAILLEEFLGAVRSRPARLLDNARVVVVGAFCEQPPRGLILTLERAGCDIVDDDFQLGLRAIAGEVPVGDGGDPLEGLVRAYLDHGTPTASRYLDHGAKGAELVERVRAREADGVIFAAASFCDPALLDQPMLESALDRAGIPHTSLKFSENTGQFQTIREQAGAFSDAVKLWGTA